ncbi:amidohydrolase family protein [Kineococcus sp. R8]|uniref:amidohydrolase family protein n=1 Tax=Kineococcus siccus TaxID=2696567 RepID=UPI0014120BE8|nr:amidohydrolase family protein [Kineococcus siccus]NAZ80396.1 amidohydrolase family protein [Kineococcus siccus]
MRIDVHAHYWAASYLDLLAELGRTDLPPMARQPDDLADRLAVMDSVGVDYQVFSAIGLNTEVAEPAGAARAARHVNDLYVDAHRRFDGRFLGFASVPLPHLDEAIAETERALALEAVKGVALPCVVAGKAIDHPDFEPFWANLARHGRTVVYVHPVGSDSAVHPGLGEWNLGMAHGSPLQIAVAPLRIWFSGLSTRYPDLQFVFALCGGNLPFLYHRQERAVKRTLAAHRGPGANRPSPYQGVPMDPDAPLAGVKQFWFDCSTQDVPLALLAAKESYGADRLLLGSDETHASLVEAVAYVRDSPHLTDAEKTAILDTNAQSLLHLPDRATAAVVR